MKLSFDDSDAAKAEDVGLVASFPVHPHSQEQKIIKRVFHTRTEFTIYPNGTIFPAKSQSWFEDKIYEHKPKVKKYAKASEEIKKRVVEEH